MCKYTASLIMLMISWSSNIYSLCRFKFNEPIVSLSGPVTHYLYQLGLHSNSKWKAISIYNGLTKDEFSGEILPGGIFIPTQVTQKYKNAYFFYDESIELEKSLQDIPENRKIKISSRDKTPFEVYRALDNEMKKYLHKDCNNQIIHLAKKVDAIEKKMKTAKLLPHPFLFFMGKILPGPKYPEQLLLNDGPGLYLIRDLNQKSYPSPLAYVHWSEKILVEFIKKEKPLIFSLQAENVAQDNRFYQQGVYQTIIEKDPLGHINIYARCGLIPGLPQIYFLEQLIDYFKK